MTFAGSVLHSRNSLVEIGVMLRLKDLYWKRNMRTQAKILKAVRLLHLYLGIFTAPALLFFAISGPLLTFSLHSSMKGSPYKPAKWIVVMSQLHRKQTAELPRRKLQSPVPATAGTPQPAETTVSRTQTNDPAPHNPLPLKIFFLIVSVGLAVSTASGLYMSYKYSRNKLPAAVLLLLGIVVPIVLALA
jgi:hypothetical protein